MTLELKDATLTCADCGEEFTFTAHLQTVFASKGWIHPKRCLDCRNAKNKMDGQSMQGTVKWFKTETGWGFITTDSGEDAFVHHHQIMGQKGITNTLTGKVHKTLVEGQRVEFILVKGKGGKPAAANVRVVEG